MPDNKMLGPVKITVTINGAQRVGAVAQLGAEIGEKIEAILGTKDYEVGFKWGND